MKRILTTPGLFNKYKSVSIYPVLIGGANAMRCSGGRGSTGDIDIKFIVTTRVKSADDPVHKLAIAMRDRFVAEVVEIANASNMLGPTTSLSISVSDPMLAERVVVYEENHATGDKQILIDTGIFSNYSMQMFDHFANFFENTNIPVHVVDGIPFATCSWVLVDTVRMLKISRDKAQGNLYWHKKYVKYMWKFALLYESYNHKTADVHMEQAYSAATKYLENTSKDLSQTAEQLLAEYSNEKYIEERFIVNPEISVCVKSVIHYLLSHTLGQHMAVGDGFYPVVLGGAGVHQCVSDAGFKINIKDVDVQFILKKQGPDILHRASLAKDKLCADILSDPRLMAHVKQLSADHGLDIELATFNDWKVGEHDKQIDMQLTIIQLVFKEPISKLEIRRCNMVDVIVLNDKIYNFNKSRKPPYVKDVASGTLYASCDFVFKNTLFMLKLYEEIEHTKKTRAKYLRYVLKYVAMFIARTKMRASVSTTLKKQYAELAHIIRGHVLRDENQEERAFSLVENMRKIVKF